ncbi:replication fork protection component Swi3-domain-containing protein [Truncatella angustata]|uniref:Chromosome segregation in meiosis protein n=1 Tax=Truncatella angustata TaxID=152316 RepID=A0A9P8UEV8_9PEZI|nr:replication fork protection component Swi3-domain-containing protein [Truncatella angustata]KAH6648676.1 replication fork protection component Swi3-domain-containing protein [Truncatella angustata]
MAPGTVVNDDLENYGVDDFDVDPFADSGDENANKADSQSKKRKDASGLGIDEAVAVTKKPRVPRVKLDDKKLLSDKGIPKLRKKAGDLKLKGKGHEFSDTAKLLSFYQLWLDDLYPKAKFLDALGMVEKAGHTGAMRMARMDWINEGKPKHHLDENEDEDLLGRPEGRNAAKFPARVAPIFQNSGRPKTPSILDDDLFRDDDLYDATPRNSRNNAASAATNGGAGDVPGDEDDLDALMAEEEAQRVATTSIFGNGETSRKLQSRPAEPDDDDLDALMAEADAISGPPKAVPKDYSSKQHEPSNDDEEDDLDALMAEAEAEGTVPAPKPGRDVNQAKVASNQDKELDADEEEAMAEMDGLW